MNTAYQLSVVIPARNEELQISRCLQALLEERQSFNHIRDIIVVDNGSTDRTLLIAEALGVTICSTEGTISRVRNVGAASSTGEILCFIDADVEVLPGWSHAIMEYAESSGDAIRERVFGNRVGIKEKGSWIEQSWHLYLEGNRAPTYINSGNLMVHRDLFERLDGFQVALMSGEDVDFCRRARDLGVSIASIPGIRTIHHGNPGTLWKFAKREFWHGLCAIDSLLAGRPKKIDLLALLFLLCIPSLSVAWWKVGAWVVPAAVGVLVAAMTALGVLRTRRVFTGRVLGIGILLTVSALARSVALVAAISRNRFRLGGGSRGT